VQYYTVYKITNNRNGKFYIGAHVTSDLNDGYMGSGKLIKRAIAKHGGEHFSKEFLAICDSSEEMFTLEREFVGYEQVNDPECYNLKEGGSGGFDWHNNNPENKWAKKKGGKHP
jgi:hypothetical protein